MHIPPLPSWKARSSPCSPLPPNSYLPPDEAQQFQVLIIQFDLASESEVLNQTCFFGRLMERWGHPWDLAKDGRKNNPHSMLYQEVGHTVDSQFTCCPWNGDDVSSSDFVWVLNAGICPHKGLCVCIVTASNAAQRIPHPDSVPITCHEECMSFFIAWLPWNQHKAAAWLRYLLVPLLDLTYVHLHHVPLVCSW